MEVKIISQSQPLRETTYHGQRYAGGEPGQTYAILIRNTNPGRCEFVVSVDGLDVHDGSEGTVKNSGLVIPGNTECIIKGWRKSLDDVAEFVLTDVGTRYAAKAGSSTEQVGVIGVAVFSEKRREVYRGGGGGGGYGDGLKGGVMRGGGPRHPVAAKPARAPLGTGHGDRVESRVGTTSFQRASARPESTVEIHYDSTANLIEHGVLPRFEPRKLQAFPGDVPSAAFCPDPIG